eukprot:TRINITY_DN741_c0_g1_i2.p1 TRINITY_DN741_c0_g1~~TRINITY_DN741_c0_g1_i2.p1  ORF type:complete len:131 (-),score=19.44 TRINITY_DN741_c0_g1_i2:21-413(-)
MTLVHSTKSLDQAGTLSGYKFRMSDNEGVKRLLRNKNIGRSYAGGTDQNNYAIDLNNFENNIMLNKTYSANRQGANFPQQGQAKFFVHSGGADSPRPITLACNNSGTWKVTSWSSITSGVKKSAQEAGDF